MRFAYCLLQYGHCTLARAGIQDSLRCWATCRIAPRLVLLSCVQDPIRHFHVVIWFVVFLLRIALSAISFVPGRLFGWGFFQLCLSGLLGFLCSAHCPVVLVGQVFSVHGLESGFLYASDLFA